VSRDLRPVICALLHDIGKPVQRYHKRREKGEEKPAYHDSMMMDIVESAGRDHDSIFFDLVGKLMGLGDVCRNYRDRAIRVADEMAASERGIGEYWRALRNVWDRVEDELTRSLKLSKRYSHDTSPLLSPLWLLKLSLSYEKVLGPNVECKERKRYFDRNVYEGDPNVRKLFDNLGKTLDTCRTKCDVDSIARSIGNMLGIIKDEPLWFSVKVLYKDDLRRLRPLRLEEAFNEIDYRDVVDYLIDGLRELVNVYNGRYTAGFVETLSEVLKYGLLLVPSAVFVSLAPDISLYSHSKLVASYVHAMEVLGGRSEFRLLVVDGRGIQEFVSAPIKAEAASRAIRGRSLLVELITESVVEYLLHLMGGLTQVNVVINEGGSPVLIIPAYDDKLMEERLRLVDVVLGGLSLRMKGLTYTMAYSRPFTPEDARRGYLVGLGDSRGPAERAFREVLESLEQSLSIRKSLDDARSTVWIGSDRIVGFDRSTNHPVIDIEFNDGYALKVDGMYKDYVDFISGRKFSEGDLLSEATHLSLVAGTAARNLALVISVYAYIGDKVARETIRELAWDILACLQRRYKCEGREKCEELILDRRLYIDIGERHDIDVALIPLPHLGALHILVTYQPRAEEYPSPYKAVERLNELERGSNCIIAKIAEKAERLTKTEEVRFKVRFKLVNEAADFVRSRDSRRGVLGELRREVYEAGGAKRRSIVERLLESGVDVSITTFHTGTFHPITEDEGGRVKLADLEEMARDSGLIGLAKMDADLMGEVKAILSRSPSRLATFSDLLSTVAMGKFHLLTDELARSRARGDGEPAGAIVLYAGGDDISFYGEWTEVIELTDRVYNDVLPLLEPVSFTTSIVIDKYDVPILDVYQRAVRQLERVKGEARGSVAIGDIMTPLVLQLPCEGRVEYRFINGIPSRLGSRGWRQFNYYLANLYDIARVVSSGDELKEYKGDIHTLSRIAYEGLECLRKLGSNSLSLFKLIRTEVYYSYLCARRDEEVGKLTNELNRMVGGGGDRIRLCPGDGMSVREGLIALINNKPLLDILLLILRKGRGGSPA
jgi:hypothetical protein